MSLRHDLRYHRELLGISQRELAQRSGTWQSQISEIENGTTDPQIGTLTGLLSAMDLELTITPKQKAVQP